MHTYLESENDYFFSRQDAAHSLEEHLHTRFCAGRVAGMLLHEIQNVEDEDVIACRELYVCMRGCMYACVGVCMHARVYVYVRECMYACEGVCMHARVYVYIRIC